MFEKRIEDLPEMDFRGIREDVASKVFGCTLVPTMASGIKITLTRVEPQGEFSTHKDQYHHVLYFLSGHGVGWLDSDEYEVKAGRAVRIPAGTLHGYRNNSSETMTLLTINIPADEI
ncbi:cupin domain-containing protein [Candidatus Thorarchaeota archaeon]|nr:MAG: cupin domain-containing protein [Candidatus Thorarchaeota archaeon]